jgi:two-component system, NarL family, nitrate/nitrite response regulator NarL
MKTLQLFLVDQSQLFRDGLRRLLDAQGCRVVGEAASLDALVEALAQSESADILVFDFAPDEDCARAIEQLRFAWPKTKLVVLSGDPTRKSLAKSIGWSVDSYLSKDMSAESLARVFELIMLDQQIFPTKLMIEMQAAAERPAGELVMKPGLSPREVEILKALVDGKSNKAIARDLAITEATVKVHLKALLRKVRVNNRTQAAVWALNQGLSRIA